MVTRVFGECRTKQQKPDSLETQKSSFVQSIVPIEANGRRRNAKQNQAPTKGVTPIQGGAKRFSEKRAFGWRKRKLKIGMVSLFKWKLGS